MSRPTRPPAASASVPIPGSMRQPSSGVESVLASFGDRFRVAARSPHGTPDAIYPSSSPSAAGHPSYGGVGFTPSTSGPTPASRSLSSQYQPRVTRAHTVDIHAANASVSTSPVRNRRSSTHYPRPPPVAPRTPVTPVTRRPSTPSVFALPPYLTNSVLIGRMVGHVPEPESETSSRPSAATLPRRVPSPARSSDSDDDGLSYPHPRRYQPQVVRPTSPGPLSLDEPLQLPTQWNDEDKSRHLSISATGKDVTFNGPSSVSDRDAAAVRAICPIPPACGVYYYEVEIINRGIKGQISVGFAVKDLHLHRLPGWEVGSWGYHGDDGMSFAGQPRSGSPFGPKFTTGDVIGCGVNFVERNAFYTKNGRSLGHVFKDLPEHGLYPAIGLRTTNEQIRTNFGDAPFKFDIETYVADVRLKTWRTIQSLTWIQAREDTEKSVHDVKVTSPPSSVLPAANISGELDHVRRQHENTGHLMANIICNYLAHEGYVNTATVLQQQLAKRREKEAVTSGMSTPKQQSTSELAPGASISSTRQANGDMEVDFDLTTDDDEVSNTVAPRSLHEFLTSHPAIPSVPVPTTPAEDTRYRRRIIDQILNGEIEEALKSLKEKYPKALLADDGLVQFRLRCQRFADMVLSTAEQLKVIRAQAEGRYPYHHQAREEIGGDVATEGANSMDLDEEEPAPLTSPVSVRFGRPLAPPGTATMNGGSNSSSLAAGISNLSALRAAAKGKQTTARRPSSSPRSPVRIRRPSHGSNHGHPQGLLTSLPPPTTSLAAQRQSEELLSRVWNYGQQLQTEFGSDQRLEVQDLLKRTVGIVAYQDPANNPQTRELVGFEAKVTLAEDVNRAILVSQGRSPVAMLERLYKQASTEVQVLGLVGVPLAAFADVDKELLTESNQLY